MGYHVILKKERYIMADKTELTKEQAAVVTGGRSPAGVRLKTKAPDKLLGEQLAEDLAAVAASVNASRNGSVASQSDEALEKQ